MGTSSYINILSSDPNDIKTLQPFTEGYKELYGKII